MIRMIRMVRRTRIPAAILLAASLALAGCAGSGGDEGSVKADAKSQARGADGPQAAEAGAFDTSGKGDKGGRAEDSGPALESAHIIRTARLSVRVKDVPDALAEVRSVAETAGGFVAREETDSYEGGRIDSTEVVLRVPSERYDEVMRDLKGTGLVTYRSSQAEDVTDQVVDVESRVKSQRAAVERLRKLMDDATELEDVVLLEGELASREAELDSLLSRQASLKDRTSLATVTLSLFDSDRAEDEDGADEDPGVLDALKGGWDAFVTTLYWIVLVVGAVLPFAVVLGALLWLWLRLRRRGRSADDEWLRLRRRGRAGEVTGGNASAETPSGDEEAPAEEAGARDADRS
ncbi:DUF4349 domain-containing protein [Streptomyces fragilis]|uniref:DUF4349 domain-containing protein n=1 Tax=Streptomyces fragilis TaxID=67301 RepID=A0ABV2YIU8_9ACTN|nr:DUF4349 domain-containing protein [Streptomyces fragilis]